MINKIKAEIVKVEYILHIADIHIRNWKRHKEYIAVFKKLYEDVDNLPPNSIVTIGGDIVHAKTDMSPELIQVVSSFFSELADRVPTIVITGNHDTNLNNNSRLDALTPIVEACKHPNLFYLRNSGVYKIGDLAISVMSLLDKKEDYVTADKIKVKCSKKVAMYHGTVANSKVDSGLSLSHGLDWDIFAGFDLVLLGDIHKRQVFSKSDPLMFFPGSLVQQNFGESFEGHGYALVKLDDLSYKFTDISNEYGFFTVDVEGDKLPDNLPITSKTNVRLRAKGSTPADLKRMLATIRKLYKNSDVLVHRLDKSGSLNNTTLFGESLNQGDIRNTQYQNQLIKDYLSQLNIDDETLEVILNINMQLNQSVVQSELARNVVWKPKKFEFSNMFSYGENNVVDFEKFDGTCGLFAPNHAGKSAVLDALCFCLFDYSARASKADQVLNNKKDNFHCKLQFELNGCDYFVEKRATRYAKGPLAGRLRVDIDFWYVNAEGERIMLNGEQRRDTDKIIQSYVGTFDDFVLTALSLQGNNSNFIEKTQSERKDLLANFLDLRLFDTLYELANKEIKTTTVLLEEYQKQDFETKLGDAERNKENFVKLYEAAVQEANSVQEDLEELQEKLQEYNKALQPSNADGLDINNLINQKKTLEDHIKNLTTKQKEIKELLDKSNEQLLLLTQQKADLVDKFDQQAFLEYESSLKQKALLDNKLQSLKMTVANKLEKLEKLKQHEYDPNCKYCTSNIFVKDAINTKEELEVDKVTVKNLLDNIQQIKDFLAANQYLEDQATSLRDLEEKLLKQESICEKLELAFEGAQKDQKLAEHKIQTTEGNIQTYQDNLAVLENNKKIQVEIKKAAGEVSLKKIELSKKTNIVKDLHSKVKVAEQTIDDCIKRIAHMQELSEKHLAYEYYCKAMCKDGIPYILIGKAVPYLQDCVNNILSQVIDFTVELETDGKNINVFICYDGNRWPLELASGMERFISSLALRIALIKITNLPKPDFMAIDEGLGVLDSSNLNSMHAFFTYIKEFFKFTLIISHIDVVRDMVDNIITIDRKDEFSHINC